MYYRVIPFERTFDTYGLIYKSPEENSQKLLSGQIVRIPLRDNEILGIIYGEIPESDIEFDVGDIKYISSIFSVFVFLDFLSLQTLSYIASHYITPIHNALNLYFPRNLLEKIGKQTFEKIIAKSYEYSEDIDIQLSEKQNEVFQKIVGDEKKLGKFLLYGVTGSGKTEIYMKLIEKNLREDKQSLLLIPEIILTSQIGERIKQVFGEEVLLLHSGVTAAKKSQYWVDIHSGNAKIIIGTRSALFYPYKNLGGIIMDEEHDPSYISDNAPRYHSLEVAEHISKSLGIPLVLGSGTPRTTTMYRSLQGEFEMLQLLEKYKKTSKKDEADVPPEHLYKYDEKYSVSSNRLSGYDYSSEGLYFITICTKDRVHYFGEIQEGIMNLNTLGKIIESELLIIEEKRKGISVEESVIMPNHVHMLLRIRRDVPVERLVQGTQGRQGVHDFEKQDVPPEHLYTEKYFSKISPKIGSLGNVMKMFKSFTTKNIRDIQKENELLFSWQSNYYEHIIRTDEELGHIKKYIIENPLNWQEDENNIIDV